MSESTSIKLADGLKGRIRAIAEEDGHSVNKVMNEALTKYAEYRERRRALRDELRAARREFEETGLHLTQEEVEEWMAKRARSERAPMPPLHT